MTYEHIPDEPEERTIQRQSLTHGIQSKLSSVQTLCIRW